jgi:protein-disulfide isomerase
MSKQFWAVIAVLVVVFFGAIIINGQKDDSSGATGTPTNHVEGSTSSGVKLVEYGDYQCPACGSFYQTVKDTVAKYQDRIQFQFRNLPLTGLHPNAFSGARAAEAAGLQGKYFAMHDMLYENQTVWSQASTPLTYFVSYAKSLKLNVDKFKTDFASSKVNSSINADMAEFNKTKAEKATPSFFLDGKQVSTDKLVDSSGQPSVDAFSKVIDAAIAAKAKTSTSTNTAQ